jgi:hypothetical protein
MDSLQKQINTLSAKVDELHQLIEQMLSRFADVVTECKLTEQGGSSIAPSYRSTHGAIGLDAIEHKDILVDGDAIDTGLQGTDRQLSPEIQIQRLTAQLTAAYSRIAALEDQLLSRRVVH